MEKSSDMSPKPSVSSLHSIGASSQSSIRPRHFQYDVLTSNDIRLFKLDINGEDAPLSGSLMTTYHLWNSLDLSKKSFVTLMKQDTESVMDILTGKDKYDTFSYSWGSQRETHDLHLSFISNRLDSEDRPRLNYESYRNGTIQIGKNLRDLLEELRRRNHKTFMWIDAICINQANDAEKKMQIPVMRNIYEYADDGYVWMGKGCPGETMAIEMLPEVVEQLTRASTNSAVIMPAREESFVDNGVISPQHNFWSALRSILKNPWWSRLWTLQEVVVPGKKGQDEFPDDFPATIVFLGNTTIRLDIFKRLSVAAASLDIRSWLITGHVNARADALYAFDGVDEIRICRESWTYDIWGVKLRALLLGTRRRKASIDADVVYGMLAMMDNHTAKLLAPNANSTAPEVFVKFAKHYIRNEHREHLFAHLATESKMDGLPSWCPNFASSPANVSLGSKWFGRVGLEDDEQEQLYHAGYNYHGKWKLPKSKAAVIKVVTNALRGRNVHHHLYDTGDPRQIALIPDSDHLLVSGMHLDVVAEFVECNPAASFSNFFSLESVLLTEQWELQCFRLAMKYLARAGNGFDVYARTLAVNRASVERSDNRPVFFDHQYQLDFVECYRQFKAFLHATKAVGDDLDAEGNLDRSSWHFMDVMSHVTRNRRFFATEDGRIGLGPRDIEVGDSVCVLFFCPTPYILRHHPTSRTQLIGEAYVNGLMYGEALEMLDKGQIEETKWVIE